MLHAPSGRFASRNDTQQRGLTRTVHTDQSDAVAALDNQVRIGEDAVVAIRVAQIVERITSR